jgi:hypothetical protein
MESQCTMTCNKLNKSSYDLSVTVFQHVIKFRSVFAYSLYKTLRLHILSCS